MTLPSWSHSQLQAKALEMTPEGRGLFDGKSLRVEALALSLGLTMMPVPGLAEVAEAFIPYKRGIIFIDENQYQGDSHRSRFTLCEELAHDILHRPIFAGMSVLDVQAVQTGFTEAQYAQLEHEAKYLAACLLMRPTWYRSDHMRLFTQQRPKCATETETLKYVVRQLGMTFNTSRLAVAVHGRNLGLLEQYQLDDLKKNGGC